jgi:cysteine desulfurase
MSGAPLYLDYAATTPVAPEVARAMSECLTADGDFGNASSLHAYGHSAAARIARARAQVAELVGAQPADIVFTSGATESNNLAILGAARAGAHRGRHLVTVRTEHKSVLDPFKQLEKEGFSVSWLTPARSGQTDPRLIAEALRADTVLVSAMLVNNETGVLADIASIAGLCRARGITCHSDCSQAVGKLPLDLAALGVDLASFTAHKLYGPKGIGALYLRSGARALLTPVSFGGGQERALRPGTLATHQIVGFGAACALAAQLLPSESARIAGLRERLWQGLAQLGGTHLNGEGPRVPGILNVAFEGVHGESLFGALEDLALSTGAACNSASAEPSYVLRALGRATQLAQSSLRFSIGRYTRDADIEQALRAVGRVLERLRALSPAAAASPATAGQWSTSGDERVIQGEAGGPDEETWVRFSLLVAGDTVKAARFRAFACPHTTQVAARLCAQLPGRQRAGLIPGTPPEWAAAEAVPVEKLGRLLVVEDALRECLLRWAQDATI